MPFVDAVREENGLSDTRLNGVGDATVNLLWRPFYEPEHQLNGLILVAGITFPTGDEEDQPLVGLGNPEVFQEGTGAYQLNLGIGYSKLVGEWNYKFNASMTTALNESDQGYEPADFYFANVSVGRALNDVLSFDVGLLYSHGDDDRFQGARLITGYEQLALKTGLVWQIDDAYSVSTAVELPLYTNVNETQIGAGTLFRLGVSRSF